MFNWSSGYNVDLGYTFGHYREISPGWLSYVAQLKGIASPSGAWRYLELGSGQGVGLVLQAALHPNHDFVGVDFNPAHIAHARELAAAAGLTNVTFEEADFLTLASGWPRAWGQFDYVTAHGIYSWLSGPVRDAFVQTIGHAAAPGALVYVSYNCLPGWVSTYPIQHLLRLWQTSGQLNSLDAIAMGSKRIGDLHEAGAAMTRVLPGIATRLEQMTKQDKNYLVQEYLHDNWQPVWFDEAAKDLSRVKLSYLSTANIGDLYLTGLLPPKFKEILAEATDPVVREVMLDVLINQNFRKDVFVRGAATQWVGRQRETLRQTRFAARRQVEPADLKFRLSIGEISGKEEVYRPLLDALAHGPKSVEELMSILAHLGNPFAETLQAVSMMLHADWVSLFMPADAVEPAHRLNRAIMTAVAAGAPYRYVLAPATGAVVQASETEMIMALHVLDHGHGDAVARAEFLVARLAQLGRSLVQDGKAITDPAAIKARALEIAQEFEQKTIPLWQSGGILG